MLDLNVPNFITVALIAIIAVMAAKAVSNMTGIGRGLV